MNFGKADRYVTIKRPTLENRNEGGDPIEDFATVVSLWGRRTYKPGSEVSQADQKVGIQNCFYELRYFEGIEQQMILVDLIDNTWWDIVSVEDIGREDFVRLECFKRDNT